jgi:NAD dependent epimerase/dehydratase family enzyme
MLLTKGQCAIPERTMASGYAFRHTQIDRALASILL